MRSKFSQNYIALALIFALLNTSTFAFVEVVLQRNIRESIPINTEEIVSSHPKIKKCANDLLKLKSNSTVITNLCFAKDLSYSVETLVGDMNFNYEIASLAIDLHSPTSWLKSTECRTCPFESSIPTFAQASVNILLPFFASNELTFQVSWFTSFLICSHFAITNNNYLLTQWNDLGLTDWLQKLECDGTCLTELMSSEFIVTNKYRRHKHCSIVSGNSMMYGEYIVSRFAFLAYNPEKKKSIFRYIEEQLQRDTFSKYEDLITF